MKKTISNLRCIRCGKKTYKNKFYCSLCLKSFYLKEYFEKNRKKKDRFIICISCGTNERVRPFIGLCESCYTNQYPLRRKYE